ncbi:Lrp/AsnC family transcriptional regulator [Natronomonas marina]|jgi:DNA-binding Lrp family transcriptional regulator|uniref:Lrp/AsnC family transcriptional regulator n=1 Tax=Natronomonas marina TaxID=2961939 RepID=UPI0020CA1BC2|nr:Lrp/AsnC family transcriptional regulator [Natronomonas marina]
MVRAFIMVKAGTGQAEALLETVRGFDHVADANIVAGDYDLIVEAEAEEVYDVINSVATEIRSLDDVVDTKTYVCLE